MNPRTELTYPRTELTHGRNSPTLPYTVIAQKFGDGEVSQLFSRPLIRLMKRVWRWGSKDARDYFPSETLQLPPNNFRFLALPPPNIRIFYLPCPPMPPSIFSYWGGACPPNRDFLNLSLEWPLQGVVKSPQTEKKLGYFSTFTAPKAPLRRILTTFWKNLWGAEIFFFIWWKNFLSRFIWRKTESITSISLFLTSDVESDSESPESLVLVISYLWGSGPPTTQKKCALKICIYGVSFFYC